MVVESLVTPPLEAGGRLVSALAADEFPMKAAAWIRDEDTWRLYLVITDGEFDRIPLYLAVARKVETLLGPDYRDTSYTLVPPDHPVGRTILSWSKPTGPDYRHMYGASGSDVYISDAYVYRLAA